MLFSAFQGILPCTSEKHCFSVSGFALAAIEKKEKKTTTRLKKIDFFRLDLIMTVSC
jgi:hypothetical protein